MKTGRNNNCLILCCFLDTFAKLRCKSISYMSVLLSVLLHWITRHPLDGFSWNLTSGYSSKVFRASLIFDHIALISAWRRKYLRLTQRNPKHTFHLWGNVEKYGRTRETKNDNTIRGMRYACWISTTTNTDSEFAKFIAFPRKKWLCERYPVLLLTAVYVSQI